MSHDDGIRVHEFYRLSAQIQDQIWPNWSETPAPLILVTPTTEFLTRFPVPPKDFTKIGEDLYARPRQFSPGFQATFPAFGPPAIIIIGEPQNTLSKTSTPWLITVMHEHFHQLQYSQPGYYEGTVALGLRRSPEDSMWPLDYPFPYDDPAVGKAFAQLRDLLLSAVTESNDAKFGKLSKEYGEARRKFFALIPAKDGKYLESNFGRRESRRCTEIKCAEAAANYQPSAEFAGLADFESFSAYAARARQKSLDQLRAIDIATSKREIVYSFGAAEGFLSTGSILIGRMNIFDSHFRWGHSLRERRGRSKSGSI